MKRQCLKEKISRSIPLKGERSAGRMNQSMYWVEGLTCAKDHLLVPKVVCPMATANPYAST